MRSIDVCMIIKIIATNRLMLFSNPFFAVIPRIIHAIATIGVVVANEYVNPSLRRALNIAHCKTISAKMNIDVAIQLNKGYTGKHIYASAFKTISIHPMNNEIFCITFNG